MANNEANKRIVITGGTGFIGSRIIEVLLGKSYSVDVLTRSPGRHKSDSSLLRYVAYPESNEGMKELIDGSYGVINLAGAPVVGKRWTDERKKVLWDSRVETTKALSEAIKQSDNPPESFISASGVGYYGASGGKVVTEGSSAGDDFLARLCVAWEETATAAQSESTKVCLMRTGLVLDKEEGALPKLALPFKLYAGGKIGDGEQYYPWIHIDDVVGMYIYYLEHDLSGAVNLTAPNPVRMKEFGRELTNVLGGKMWAWVPSPIIKLALGEASITVLKGQNAIPEKGLEDGYRFEYASLNNALKDIYGNA